MKFLPVLLFLALTATPTKPAPKTDKSQPVPLGLPGTKCPSKVCY